MPLSEFLQDTLDSISQSVKKVPTSIVGGPADLMNTVLGGFANIADLAQGKQITRSPGQGLVDKPLGGSEMINDIFGIDNQSKGLVENSVSAMLGAVNPSMAVKTAMIVPAVLLKSGKTVALAEAALNKGRSAEEVFKNTGVYKDPADGMMKAVMDDSAATLGKHADMPVGKDLTLGDIMNHPALYDAVYGLEKTPVKNITGAARGSYSKGEISLNGGLLADDADFLSTTLHETQHLIQDVNGFAGGSNPSMFFARPQSFNSAVGESNKIMNGINPDLIAQTMDPALLLEAKNAGKMSQVLKKANNKSYENYRNTAGEVEARRTQAQFASGDYSQLPTTIDVGQGPKLISDPLMGNKVDNDPMVKAVVDYLNDLKNFNK